MKTTRSRIKSITHVGSQQTHTSLHQERAQEASIPSPGEHPDGALPQPGDHRLSQTQVVSSSNHGENEHQDVELHPLIFNI